MANEYSRVADEVTDLKNDAEQVWTEVRRAVAHGEGNLQTEGNEQGLKFQDLAKDAGKLAKELLGEVSRISSPIGTLQLISHYLHAYTSVPFCCQLRIRLHSIESRNLHTGHR